MDSNSYVDAFGLIHANKGQFSENGPLFAAEYWVCERILKGPKFNHEPYLILDSIVKEDGNNVWFDPNPSDNNLPDAHFSHDNMTGVYCLSYVWESRRLELLPIFKWNYRVWLHPRDSIFYSILKNNKLAFLGLPILFIMSMISAEDKREKTSGKCLWFLRYLTLSQHKNKIVSFVSKLFFKAFSKSLEREHGAQPFKDVFAIYFKEEAHPIHRKIADMYVYGKL